MNIDGIIQLINGMQHKYVLWYGIYDASGQYAVYDNRARHRVGSPEELYRALLGVFIQLQGY